MTLDNDPSSEPQFPHLYIRISKGIVRMKWHTEGFHRSFTEAAVFSVYLLSGSCGWSPLSRGLLGGHSFFCRKYPPSFPGIQVGTGHYFLKKQKMFQAHWQASHSFLPGRMKKKNQVWFSSVPRMAFKQGVGSELWVERGLGHRDEECVIHPQGWLPPDTRHLGIFTKPRPPAQTQGR